MAILNIDENEMPVDAEISAELIDDLASVTYVVYEYFSQETCILKSGESFFVNLKNANDYKFYIFAPVKNGFAAIGRIDKFLAPKTIQYVCGQKIILKEEGPYAYVKDGKLIIR